MNASTIDRLAPLVAGVLIAVAIVAGLVVAAHTLTDATGGLAS